MEWIKKRRHIVAKCFGTIFGGTQWQIVYIYLKSTMNKWEGNLLQVREGELAGKMWKEFLIVAATFEIGPV